MARLARVVAPKLPHHVVQRGVRSMTIFSSGEDRQAYLTLVALRRAVRLVALLNLSYFGVEFAVARTIGSVSLFADSIDFLEDATVNLLILVALGWSAHRRSLVGMALAAILLVPGISTLWTAWEKFFVPTPPDAALLSLTGFGALTINLFCAYLLVRFRAHSGSLTRAAFLSARNDALGNIAIVAAGLVTAATVSPWPDLVVGLGIFLMNLDAAREVYTTARKERSVAFASVKAQQGAQADSPASGGPAA